MPDGEEGEALFERPPHTRRSQPAGAAPGWPRLWPRPAMIVLILVCKQRGAGPCIERDDVSDAATID